MTVADEIARLLTILFDDPVAAEAWMASAHTAFGDRSPRELVKAGGDDALAIVRHLRAWSAGGPFTSPIAGFDDDASQPIEVEFDPVNRTSTASG